MSEWDSTARRRELGASLRRLRERRGITGSEMAALLHMNPSTLSRLETGKRPTSAIEVVRYTSLCGVIGEEQDRLALLADAPDDYRLTQHEGEVPDLLGALMFHESSAIAIETFQPWFLPGVTQTEGYIRALFNATGLIEPTELENLVQLRLTRRAVLTRMKPAQLTMYIHENVLRLAVGEPAVMCEQLLHLLFVADRPQCTLRVVPNSSGVHGAAMGAFNIFSYADGAPLVYVENQTTSEFLESPQELKSYRTTLQRVAGVALGEQQSKDCILRMVSHYDQQGATSDGSDAGPPTGLAQE